MVDIDPGRGPFNPSSDSKSEVKERFYRFFQEEATELQEQMSQLEDLSLIGGERADAIDHCLAGITRLSDEVADAADFIPAYDQRTYSQVRSSDSLEETYLYVPQ
jgi:hypothetical protein